MKYFYAWGLLFFLPFAIYTYIKANKEERLKMIVSGIGFGMMSIVFDYLFFDYWKPVFLIDCFHFEDFLYGFIFAGILPAIHNIFGNRMVKGKYGFNIKLAILFWLILLNIFGLVVYVFEISYIYALSLTPFVIGIISCIMVKGNIKDVLITTLVSVLITFFAYSCILLIYPSVFVDNYLLDNLSGVIILGIPLEEYLFAIGIGVGTTYTYEAVFKLK